VARALLVSAVAAGTPAELLTRDGHAEAVQRAADADTDAAAFAANAAFATCADAVAYAAAAAAVAAYADAFAAATWSALRSDCDLLADGKFLSRVPLWPGEVPSALRQLSGEPPQALGISGALHRERAGAEVDWSFWRDWYRRAQNGEPQNWEMLLEIAIQEEAFWEGSDAAVNARINEIVARHTKVTADIAERAKANSANAERIVVNEAGQFDAEPLVDITPEFFAEALQRVRDAIDEMQAIPTRENLHGACDREIDMIERDVARYANVPLRVYEVLVQVVRDIDARSKDGDLPDGDRRLDRFRTQLDNSALDILQNDLHVREKVTLRAIGLLDRLEQVDREHIKVVAELFAEGFAPQLAEELVTDGDTVADPTAEKEAQADALYRVGSRGIRIWDLSKNSADNFGKFGKAGEIVERIIYGLFT
jgi:hypothetical protein